MLGLPATLDTRRISWATSDGAYGSSTAMAEGGKHVRCERQLFLGCVVAVCRGVFWVCAGAVCVCVCVCVRVRVRVCACGAD